MPEEACGQECELEKCADKVYAALEEVRRRIHREYMRYREVEVEDFKNMVKNRIEGLLKLRAHLEIDSGELVGEYVPELSETTVSVREGLLYVDCGQELGTLAIPMLVLQEEKACERFRVLGFYAPRREKRFGGFQLLDPEVAGELWISVI